MQYPLTAPEVAEMFNLSIRAVHNWARKNNIRTFGAGKRSPFIFFEEDIENFKNRPVPGNPNFGNLKNSKKK